MLIDIIAHLHLLQMAALASVPLLVVALVVVRRRRASIPTRNEVTVTEQVNVRRPRVAHGSTPPPFTAAPVVLPRAASRHEAPTAPMPTRSKRKTGLRPSHPRR